LLILACMSSLRSVFNPFCFNVTRAAKAEWLNLLDCQWPTYSSIFDGDSKKGVQQNFSICAPISPAQQINISQPSNGGVLAVVWCFYSATVAVLCQTFVHKLCYKLMSIVTITFIQIFDQTLSPLLNSVKVAVFA